MTTNSVDISGKILKGHSIEDINLALISTYSSDPKLLTFLVCDESGCEFKLKLSITAFWYEGYPPVPNFMGVSKDGSIYVSSM